VKKYDIGYRPWIGLLLFIIGAVLFYNGTNLIYKANASLKWPSVDGQVRSSSVQTNHKGDSPTYIPDVGYSYLVNKDSYFNTRLVYGNRNSGRIKDVQKVIDQYPVGRTVKVYYNPSNPSESVIEPGEIRNTWDGMALALMVLSIGKLVYRNPRRKVPKTREKKPLPEGTVPMGGEVNPRTEDGFKVKVMFRFNLVFTCTWIASGILAARIFKPQDFTTGFITWCALVFAGLCFEALWYRSWRVFRRNVEGILTVIVWQLFLRQCGVDGYSMDFILFVIASLIVGYRKAKVLPGVTTFSGGVVNTETAAINAPIGAQEPAVTVPPEPEVVALPQGRFKNLRFVYCLSVFYILTSATLFFFMMGLKQWAEDDGHTMLQPMYAWLAALAFFNIILSMFFWQINWRCQYCGKQLPDRERRNKTRVIRCPNCNRMNKC